MAPQAKLREPVPYAVAPVPAAGVAAQAQWQETDVRGQAGEEVIKLAHVERLDRSLYQRLGQLRHPRRHRHAVSGDPVPFPGKDPSRRPNGPGRPPCSQEREIQGASGPGSRHRIARVP